jgi:peptidoglycan-associated lipoprotein
MGHLRPIGLVVLATTVLCLACGKKAQPVTRVDPSPAIVETAPPPPPPPAPQQAAAPSPAPAPDEPLTEEDLFARKTLEELNAERPLGHAFFDLDEFVVREDARPIMQQNAEWLRRWTSTRITIEGHADDRGTREYNLALGDRRANALREYLTGLGVSAGRIMTLSKGKESPVCTEPHEECWQQNRRGHFVITAK